MDHVTNRKSITCFLSPLQWVMGLDASLQSVSCHNQDPESIQYKLDLLKSMKNNDSCFPASLKTIILMGVSPQKHTATANRESVALAKAQ